MEKALRDDFTSSYLLNFHIEYFHLPLMSFIIKNNHIFTLGEIMNQKEKNAPDKLFEFEKFDLYQRALEYTNSIVNLTKNFPKFKFKELISQLDRSALSITLNLAEGFSSFYKKEKKKYFRTARNSTNECVPALQLALKQELVTKNDYNKLYQESFEISCMISGLIKSVDKRLED